MLARKNEKRGEEMEMVMERERSMAYLVVMVIGFSSITWYTHDPFWDSCSFFFYNLFIFIII